MDALDQLRAGAREAMRQMPNAKSIYDKMTPASKERVDKVLADVDPYNHAKRFVAAVRKEMDRVSFGENRKALRSPGAAVG